MKKFCRIDLPAVVTAVLSALLPIAGANAIGLEGVTVSYAGYCCVAPTPPYLVTNNPSAVVGSAIEFPLGSVVSNGTLNVIPFSADLSADLIDVTFFSSGTLLGGTFNGGVFTFSGLSGTRIVDVTVDPLSQFVPTSLSFTADSISSNAAGESFTAGTHELLRVRTAASTVPEPSVVASFAIGLAGLVGLRRRPRIRQRSCASATSAPA